MNRHAREGAARFKLAVSAFHHPGRPWAPHRGHEPIGTRLPNSGRADRCCLILLMSEGASDRGKSHQHLPIALRAVRGLVCGMTEFHRPNEGAPPVLDAKPTQGPSPGRSSSPGMTALSAVRLEAVPGTGTAADYTARSGGEDGTRPQQYRRPDRSAFRDHHPHRRPDHRRGRACHGSFQDLRTGRDPGGRPRPGLHRLPAGRVHRDHGPLRVRQVDADALRGRPRHVLVRFRADR